MKWIIPVILIGGLLISFPASAEFYKYYDEDGNTHYTDDYNRVPPEQRDDVEGYDESISEEPDLQEEPEELDTAESEEETEEVSETAGDEESDFEKEIGELDQRKAEMEQEYDSLVKEKERLTEMRKDVKTQKQAKGYNESVKALNQRLQEHDQKRKDLVSEIQRHNDQLAEKKADRKRQSARKEDQD